MRYGTAAFTVQCHCTKCGKDDHSTKHHDIYSDVQERRAARGAKAMAATSTQSDAPGHLFCLMTRIATTTSTSRVASESLTLLLEEDDDPQIVMLVGDEHGTEFKFSGAMPDTLGHSGTIGKIKAAIGDRDRIGVDAAGAFLHTPLLAAGAFAYLPPLPSAEGLAYLEQLQPVVDLRAHGPVVIAQSPELSTNKSGEISSNLIKIGNYDEMVTCDDEPVMRDHRSCHNDIMTRHEIGLAVMWRGVALMWHGAALISEGACWLCIQSNTPA